MFFDQAQAYALGRLERELSPQLSYHGPFHTRDDVVPAAQRLAAIEGIHGESLNLLLTAAWFHDIGYVERPLHHELIGARIVEEVLPEFKYNKKQIEIVKWAILATALPQAPQTKIEEILTDADLDVLGRGDFLQRNRDLRRELAYLGKEHTDAEWYTGQLKFIEAHQYFTESARALRNQQKKENINALRREWEAIAQGA
jgi:uncharacterized protein